MGKKAVIGNTVEIDLEVVEEKKKKMNDKMAALRAKRSSKIDSDTDSEPVVIKEIKEIKEIKDKPKKIKEPVSQPAPALVPEPAPAPPKKERVSHPKKNYLTTEDFNSFKTDLLNQLRPVEKIVEREKIVDKIVDRPIDRIVVQQLTGSSLLDEIFFKKRL